MPFTFAHPAIVLPLRKSRQFHFPALVIGSLAPDFEYFFRMEPFSTFSHTVSGVLYFGLPLVIALWWSYVNVVERTLVRCLPSWIGKSLGERRRQHSMHKGQSWRTCLVFVYSAILGICSHLIWDAFTHQGAFAVARLPFLQQYLSLGDLQLPVYKVLQHGSTCVGLAAIALVIWKSGRGIPESHTACRIPFWMKGLYWMGIVAGGAGVACLSLIGKKSALTPAALLSGVVPFLSGSMMALIFFSWLFGRYGLKK